jgi:hypothetical protein
LTAISAIFIASKLLETVSLKMEFCIQTLGHGKYSREQILKKERLIMQVANWEISVIT